MAAFFCNINTTSFTAKSDPPSNRAAGEAFNRRPTFAVAGSDGEPHPGCRNSLPALTGLELPLQHRCHDFRSNMMLGLDRDRGSRELQQCCSCLHHGVCRRHGLRMWTGTLPAGFRRVQQHSNRSATMSCHSGSATVCGLNVQMCDIVINGPLALKVHAGRCIQQLLYLQQRSLH